MPQHEPLQLREGEDLVCNVIGEIFDKKVFAADGDSEACIHFRVVSGGCLHINTSIGTEEKLFPKVIIEADPTSIIVFHTKIYVNSITFLGAPFLIENLGYLVVGRQIPDNFELVRESYDPLFYNTNSDSYCSDDNEVPLETFPSPVNSVSDGSANDPDLGGVSPPTVFID